MRYLNQRVCFMQCANIISVSGIIRNYPKTLVTPPPPGRGARQQDGTLASVRRPANLRRQQKHKETIRSQLQSRVTSYLTTHFSIIGLLKQPFKQIGLIHTNSH